MLGVPALALLAEVEATIEFEGPRTIAGWDDRRAGPGMPAAA